jgi:hypothetical protein
LPRISAALRFFVDLGRDSRVARLVDDFVFFGFSELPSFGLDFLSVSLPVRDLRDIALFVFLGKAFTSSLVTDGGSSSVVALAQVTAWLC